MARPFLRFSTSAKLKASRFVKSPFVPGIWIAILFCKVTNRQILGLRKRRSYKKSNFDSWTAWVSPFSGSELSLANVFQWENDAWEVTSHEIASSQHFWKGFNSNAASKACEINLHSTRRRILIAMTIIVLGTLSWRGLDKSKAIRYATRHLFNYLRTNEGEILVRYQGIKMYSSPRDTGFTPDIIRKDYEREEIGVFRRTIKKGMNVVDAGANIGLYSVIASKLVGRVEKCTLSNLNPIISICFRRIFVQMAAIT
jgi:hypothetical protein